MSNEFSDAPPVGTDISPVVKRRRKRYVREADGEDAKRIALAKAGVTSYKLKWPGRNGAPDRMDVSSTGLPAAAMYLRRTLHEQGGRDMTQEIAEHTVKLIIASVITFVEHKSGTDVSRRQSREAEALRAAGLTVEVTRHR